MTDTNQLIERLREYGDEPQDVSDGEWAEWSHKTADVLAAQQKRIEELERVLSVIGDTDNWSTSSGYYDSGLPIFTEEAVKEHGVPERIARAALAGKGGAA